jgi:dihydrofolate synthase/folylpolyglutamate synthase
VSPPADEAWQAALDRLYGFANFEVRPPESRADFELGRMRALLDGLGNPQSAWPAVHVGGTNGKGSTCAYLEAMLRAAGYEVGMFSSPHLHTVRERIQVSGQLVSKAFVIEWLAAHDDLLQAHSGLTTFEVLTALACSAFAAAGVDIAVVEVGLGGRLDTTRVVRPEVTVLTPIDLDHTEILGNTVAEIAADKAGIVVRGVPVVCAPQPPDALSAVEAAAAAAGSPIHLVGRDVLWSERLTSDGDAVDVTLRMVGRDHRPHPRPTRTLTFEKRLPGAYQAVNLATAAAAAWVLAGAGWSVPEGALVGGAATAKWPARFHLLPSGPTSPPGISVLVDGAHNPAGAAALAGALGRRGARAMHLLLGVSRDKDLAGILRPLVPMAATVTAVASRHPRALAAAAVAEAAEPFGVPVSVGGDPAAALRLTLDRSLPGDLIVAAGSLFVAAAVREAWLERSGLPLPERDGPPHG